MSHVSDVALQIEDLDAAAEAAPQCGLVLGRGQTTWKWFGRFLNDWHNSDRAAAMRGFSPKQFGHSEHALRLAGTKPGESYEVGLVPRRDGKPGWELLFDAYGTGGRRLEDAAGKNLATFRDHYAAAVARKEMARQGYRTAVRRNKDSGKLELECLKA